MLSATSLWHLSKAESRLRTAPLTTQRPGQVLVRSLYSLISSGTETLVATGKVPAELFTDMAVPYLEGSFAFPVKYGYSLVGEVVTADHPLTGRLVHALHPHQDLCYIHPSDLFPIPATVPPQRAVLASNMETAVNALWDSSVSLGDRVLVVGCGLIGSLVARLLSLIPGVELTLVENNDRRRAIAKQMGFLTCSTHPPDAVFDIAFHASATAAGLQTCIDSVGEEGKIIELSWYGNQSVKVQLGATFHSGRKQLISSQVANIPAGKSARWNHHRRKQVVFELLKNPVFEQHITQFIDFEQTPEFFQALRNRTPDGIGYGVKYNNNYPAQPGNECFS